jgi:hypothetical protein
MQKPDLLPERNVCFPAHPDVFCRRTNLVSKGAKRIYSALHHAAGFKGTRPSSATVLFTSIQNIITAVRLLIQQQADRGNLSVAEGGGVPMDAKNKLREAIRSRDEALSEVVKAEDRGKREILEQLRDRYRQVAKLLVRLLK